MSIKHSAKSPPDYCTDRIFVTFPFFCLCFASNLVSCSIHISLRNFTISILSNTSNNSSLCRTCLSLSVLFDKNESFIKIKIKIWPVLKNKNVHSHKKKKKHDYFSVYTVIFVKIIIIILIKWTPPQLFFFFFIVGRFLINSILIR